MQLYPTDLTDNQWSKIEKLFDNKKCKHSLKAVVNSLFYITNANQELNFLVFLASLEA